MPQLPPRPARTAPSAAERLDVALVSRGLFSSRAKARAAVDAGSVWLNGEVAAKASAPVAQGDVLEVRGDVLPFVGRGGLKLRKALDVFGLDLEGRSCADVGASTGGFTDCMLQAGAAHVTSIDVGHGQLDPALAADPRVTNREGCDVRAANPAELGAPFDFVATDVSFISLGKVLGSLAALAGEGAPVVCLVKPQFECGPEAVGKRGVVKDAAVHRTVVARVAEQAAAVGLAPQALDFSPVTGPEGNIEYLLLCVKGAEARPLDVAAVVAAAHDALDRRR
jgi:23S rRNA (cytidine1920-2'-O)/16S rRNA (cytidine1409-2'-O)-methyltransferase